MGSQLTADLADVDRGTSPQQLSMSLRLRRLVADTDSSLPLHMDEQGMLQPTYSN